MRLRCVSSGLTTLVACALAVTACSGTAKASAPTAPATSTTIRRAVTVEAYGVSPACHRPHTAGQFSQAFTFEGKSRTYQLYVPAAYTGAAPVPLVFNFHGFGSDAVQQMAYGNFKPEADQHDFLIVAPDGQDSGGGRHFNLTGEKGLQNDITMVGSLLSHIEATLCVDAARVYSTGMSDGGAMTSVLACVDSDKFAAFAPVAVIIYCGSAKSRPVALEAFDGTADPIVPFYGGAVHCCGGAVLGSKPVAMANWAAHDHCDKKFTDTRLGTQVVRRTWSGCVSSSSTVFYIIEGGGHTWPGAIPIPPLGLTTDQVNASQEIWKFFSAHTLSS
jgi:polyhydroxybutyrate depolymerase